MAISVGRVSPELGHTDRLASYGARLAAFLAYAGAVAIALVLLGPVLFPAEPAPARIPAKRAHAERMDLVRTGDDLALVAARNGISVTRLFALNPELGPFSVKPGSRLRVR